MEAIADGGASYLELLSLENDSKRIAAWNGAYPQVMSGGGASTPVVVPIPIK
jgi:hypothetical protein